MIQSFRDGRIHQELEALGLARLRAWGLETFTIDNLANLELEELRD